LRQYSPLNPYTWISRYGGKEPGPKSRGDPTSILSRHRLQHGLQGYLILFDPHTLVLDWQVETSPVLSLLAVLKGVQEFHLSPLSTLDTITTSVSPSTTPPREREGEGRG